MKRMLVVKRVFVCNKEGEPLYSGEKSSWRLCLRVPRWLGVYKATERERRDRVSSELVACKWLCENTPAGELRTLVLKRYFEIANREGVARRGCL